MITEDIKRARQAAITEALKHVKDGMVIGFGTGTTIAQLADELSAIMRREKLHLSFIPSSLQSKQLLLEHGMPLTTLDEHPRPDLTIDGFDQVSRGGDVIKGGGAALLREKVLAQAAEKVVYVGDYKKFSDILDKSIPIEVLEFAYPHVQKKVRSLGGKIALRQAQRKSGPIISDNGNPIADVDLGPLENPKEADLKLKTIAGVIETGIFPKPADLIIIGYPDGTVRKLEPRREIHII